METLLLFVLIFGSLVFIHELGHFIAARLCGIEVEEFAFGLPPRLFTLFTWQGTAFTINALPFGGFVKPRGEDDPDLPMGLAAASPWARFTVAIAGPVMNIVLGVIVFSILFAQIGVPDQSVVLIGSVEAGAPADQSGIKVGDQILKVNNEAMSGIDQVRAAIYAHLDQPVEIVLLRDGAEITLTVTPLSSRVEIGAMGVLLDNPEQKVNFIQAIPAGIQTTGAFIHQIITLPGRLIAGEASPDEGRLMGMYSIYSVLDQAVERDTQTRQPSAPDTTAPTYYVLNLIATLTLSLGIFNLFPFPALDGGHIMFSFIEMISRRKIPAKFQNTVNGVAFMLLLLLMAYVNIMDFVNPVNIQLP